MSDSRCPHCRNAYEAGDVVYVVDNEENIVEKVVDGRWGEWRYVCDGNTGRPFMEHEIFPTAGCITRARAEKKQEEVEYLRGKLATLEGEDE